VRLGLELPSISRRRRRFFGGFRLGVAQPGAAQRRRGGAQGGVRPLRPSEFCAVAGRERAFGPIRRAKWAKIGALWAAGGTARSRQDEPIERRPEEQGTQDAQHTYEGMWISAAMAIEPPPCEGMRLNPSWGLWVGRSPAQVPRSGAGGGRRGGSAPPAPAIFAQLLGGRGPLGLPEGPNRPKNGLLWPTQAHEISSRRAERGA